MLPGGRSGQTGTEFSRIARIRPFPAGPWRRFRAGTPVAISAVKAGSPMLDTLAPLLASEAALTVTCGFLALASARLLRRRRGAGAPWAGPPGGYDDSGSRGSGIGGLDPVGRRSPRLAIDPMGSAVPDGRGASA